MNRGLGSSTLAFFAGFSAVALFGITVLRIGPELHLSLVEKSWLVAIPTLTGAFLRIPFSLMVDKWGRITLLIQLLLGLLGQVGIVTVLENLSALPHQQAYFLLLLFGALAGTGISTFSSGITYVSYFFPQRRQGYALGVFAGFGNSAPGIFTSVLPLALSYLGLIYSYVAWATFLLIVIVVYFIISIDPPYFKLVKTGKTRLEAESELRSMGLDIIPSTNLVSSLRSSFKNTKVLFLTFMYFTSFGGFEALTEWFPIYWKGFLNVSPVEAGLLTGVVYSLLTALIRVPSGLISDKLGGELMSILSFSVLIAGSLIFIFARSVPTAVLAEILMAMGMGIGNGAVFKMVPEYAPRSVSGASGLVGGLGSAGGLMIPPVMGYITSDFAYPLAFLVFTSIGLASLILSVRLLKSKEVVER
ncbi:MFS transporter [Metallosphaera hakonensis]|uniref:MFS transporter n=1 Tax=Metallosphaera hakonensis TaxID=79601 RepID=UPI00269C92DB